MNLGDDSFTRIVRLICLTVLLGSLCIGLLFACAGTTIAAKAIVQKAAPK